MFRLYRIPIWWYTAPHIVNSFIEANDLGGKEIYLFATSGSSDIGRAVSELQAEYTDLDIKGGKLVNGPITKDIVK